MQLFQGIAGKCDRVGRPRAAWTEKSRLSGFQANDVAAFAAFKVGVQSNTPHTNYYGANNALGRVSKVCRKLFSECTRHLWSLF